MNEPLFEEWLVTERERLREVALDGLTRLLAHHARSAGPERAIQTAVRLLGLDPLQEAVHRTLMRLYARQGRRGAALNRLDEAQRLATLAIESASGRTDFVPDTLQLLGDIATHPERFDAGSAEAR